MKQVFKSNIGLVVEDVPIPSIGKGRVLVKVCRSLISTGTETASFRKNGIKDSPMKKAIVNAQKMHQYIIENGISAAKNKLNQKINPSKEIEKLQAIGYSCAGIIVEKGDGVQGFSLGDRVACAGSGIATHSEYVSVPINLVAKIPDSVSMEAAAFTTVGCISLQGFRRANLGTGEVVVIIGLGLLGLLAVQIAKASGCIVIGIDLHENKIRLAQEMGADYVFNGAKDDVVKAVSAQTDLVGADAVLVCAASKSSTIINQAIEMCKRKGKVIVVGDVAMDIARDHMYEKELDLLMSTSYGPGRYDDNYELKGNDYPISYVRWTENRNMQHMLRMLEKKQVRIDGLLSKVFKVNDAPRAFRFLVDNPHTAIGALLEYECENIADSKPESFKYSFADQSNVHTVGNKIKVGFIGVGGFMQRNHLPNMQKMSSTYKIWAICDSNQGQAKLMGKKYSAQYVTTDYKELLSDEDIDAVFIGTRHDSHGYLVRDSLLAGKHVFVEKPLCINHDELDLIHSAYSTAGRSLYVGFNRRFSPLVDSIKKELAKSSAPMVISYRINAGYIPSVSWIQNPKIGGGRVIGECCHFIDLIRFIADNSLESYHVKSIPKTSKAIESSDNLMISFAFSDGSIAELIYTSVGSSKVPKERLEIHSAGNTYILDDFKEVNKFLGVQHYKIKSKEIAKGYKEEIESFASLIRGGKNDMPFSQIFDTTKMTLDVQDNLDG